MLQNRIIIPTGWREVHSTEFLQAGDLYDCGDFWDRTSLIGCPPTINKMVYIRALTPDAPMPRLINSYGSEEYIYHAPSISIPKESATEKVANYLNKLKKT